MREKNESELEAARKRQGDISVGVARAQTTALLQRAQRLQLLHGSSSLVTDTYLLCSYIACFILLKCLLCSKFNAVRYFLPFLSPVLINFIFPAIGAQKYDWGKIGKSSSVAQFAAATDPNFVIGDNTPYAEVCCNLHEINVALLL